MPARGGVRPGPLSLVNLPNYWLRGAAFLDLYTYSIEDRLHDILGDCHVYLASARIIYCQALSSEFIQLAMHRFTQSHALHLA